MDTLNRLIRWIARILRLERKPEPRRPEPIEPQWESPLGRLERVKRHQQYAVYQATYIFHPKDGVQKYTLACDRLPPSQRRTAGIRHGKPAKAHPTPSHLLSLVRSEVAGSRVHSFVLFRYPVDFTGTHGNYKPEDWYARRFTADLAALLLGRVPEAIDWEDAIDAIASECGASHRILAQHD